MADLLYAVTNLIDGATITVSSEDSNFAKANLYDGKPGRPFRFASAAADDMITIDFGAATQWNFVSIHGHNIDSGVTAIQARSSTDNFSGSDDLEITFTKRNPAFYGQPAATVNRRYARIKFAGTNGSPIQAGELFFGVTATPDKNPRVEEEELERRRQIRNETSAGEISVINLTDFPQREKGWIVRGLKSELDDLREAIWETTNHGAEPLVIVPNDEEAEVLHGRLRNELGVNRLSRIGTSTNWLYEWRVDFKESSFGVTVSA
jgi:hypothetical protein